NHQRGHARSHADHRDHRDHANHRLPALGPQITRGDKEFKSHSAALLPGKGFMRSFFRPASREDWEAEAPPAGIRDSSPRSAPPARALPARPSPGMYTPG